MHRQNSIGLCLPAVLLIAACGDCVAIGTPVAYVSARERDTGQRVPLSGAKVSHSHPNGSVVSMFTGQEGMAAFDTLTIYSSGGRLALRVDKQGYIPWDTAVTVRTRGHCDTPVPVTVVARLRRSPSLEPVGGSGAFE